MNKRVVLAIVVSFGVAACSGSGSQAKSDDTVTESGGASADGAPTKTRDARGATLRFDDASPRAVSLLDFRGPRLAVGFSDGNIALVDPGTSDVKSARVAEVFAVDAVAPHGDLALLAKNPPVIVNFDGDLILQMNTVSDYESASFSSGGLPLFVADKKGKVRIWGQSHSFEEDQHKEKLENYLNRQAPDFHVELSPIRGPIHVMDDGRLVVVDIEGIVRVWDQTSPSTSKRIMKLDGAVRSLDSGDGYIYATSVTGALKVGKADGGYLPWSADARGGYVAASRLAAGTFFVVDSNQLKQLTTETGETVWRADLPDGHACGIDVSDDAKTLAVCVGNYVALFDASDGTPRSYLYRDGENVVWKSVTGDRLH